MSTLIERIKRPGHAMAGMIRKFYFLFPSDALYLKIIYRLEMGHKLDLKNPHTFTEKLQWLKIYDRKQEYIQMVDKIKAKEYVARIIGDEYIIPTLGTWNHFDEIDFSKLPRQFVLKSNQGGAGGGVVICRDKEKFDMDRARRKLEHSLKVNCYPKYREWPYKNISSMIFAESFIFDKIAKNETDLIDYKWFCFNGEPRYCQVIQNRSTKETIDFFDTEWNHQSFVGLNPSAKSATIQPKRPLHLDKMMSIAKTLAKNILFCRIDLYEVNNCVYFGEITFYPASGFGRFAPARYDEILGEMLHLPTT